MAITLADVKKNTQDHIAAGVIDEFRKGSFLLDAMVFDDAVSPNGGGSTLTYGYTRVTSERGAGSRAFNAEYAKQEARKDQFYTNLRPFGGAFEIDRVLAKVGSTGIAQEVNFQMQQLVKSTRAYFHDQMINGDVATDANGFDGINKALTGSSTEYSNTAVTDLSTSAAMESAKFDFTDKLEEFLALLDGTPTALMGNTKLINKIKSIAARLGYDNKTLDGFGRRVDSYGDIPLIDLGAKAGSNNPILPIVSRTVGTAQTGLADLYAVRIGLDGVHGVGLNTGNLMDVWLPDFSTAGAVKTGEVEMVAGIAVKATKAAAVFRNIKVQ